MEVLEERRQHIPAAAVVALVLLVAPQPIYLVEMAEPERLLQ
jgi:hypothetical protein